jgi:hypothetical protein
MRQDIRDGLALLIFVAVAAPIAAFLANVGWTLADWLLMRVGM